MVARTNDLKKNMPTFESNTELLVQAAQNGNFDEVARLIPRSNPKYDNSRALQYASENGHTECVALLIPVSDPKAQNSLALQWAVLQHQQQCIDLLFPVSEPMVALNELKLFYPGQPQRWTTLENRIQADRMKTVLHQEVGKTTGVKVQRKM